jgi:uncharacterized membrane protein YdjX (TVP38/TMEM64 family)
MLSFLAIAIGFSILVTLNSFSHEKIQTILSSSLPNGFLGVLWLTLILSLLLSVGLPRQVAAFSLGYLYGIGWGVLLATLTATIACIITLQFSRYFFSSIVRKSYPKQLYAVVKFFATETFTKALIIRLLPAGSNFLTNVLAGLAKVNKTPYVLGSCLGFIPQMFIFSMLGSGIQLAERQQIFISLALLLIATLLSIYLYKKSQLKKYVITE